jgi:hypothetical protein
VPLTHNILGEVLDADRWRRLSAWQRAALALEVLAGIELPKDERGRWLGVNARETATELRNYYRERATPGGGPKEAG